MYWSYNTYHPHTQAGLVLSRSGTCQRPPGSHLPSSHSSLSQGQRGKHPARMHGAQAPELVWHYGTDFLFMPSLHFLEV